MSKIKLKMRIGVKRILSVFLTLMLVQAGVPFTRFTSVAKTLEVSGETSTELQSRIDEAESGDIIEISGIIDMLGPVTIKEKDITLKGKGCLKRKHTLDNIIKIESKGTVTMDGITIDGDNLENRYAAVKVDNYGKFIMKSGKIINNDGGDHKGGDYGGGIYNYRGTVTISGGTISNNKTYNDNGGGIYNNGGTVNISGGIISENNAPNDNGGGIYNNGIVNVNGGTINKNTANKDGGGIYNDKGTVTISGGEISENTAKSGSGIYNNGGIVTMNGGIISKNKTNDHSYGGGIGGQGGGIYNYEGGTVTINKGTINDNASGSGGGIWNKGNLELKEGVISLNTASGSGGGIRSDNCFIMSGGIIKGNTASSGGGIHNSKTLKINGGEITGNTAESGGGVCNSYGDYEMTGGTISSNTATSNGGGVYLDGVLTMSGGMISGNAAKNNGGGAYLYGDLIMSGGIISDNTASNNGGGVYIKEKVDRFWEPIHVKGDARIIDNGLNNDNNVRFGSRYDGYEYCIMVDGSFTGLIGVKRELNELVAKGTRDYKLSQDDADHFVADDLGIRLKLENGSLFYKEGYFIEEFQSKIDKAADRSVITVNENIVVDKTIEINKNITLKGTGSLSRHEKFKDKILNIGPKANVLLDGITIDGNDFAGSTGSAVYINSGASLTMKDASVIRNIANNGGGVYVCEGGKFKVKGATKIIDNGVNKNDNVRFASENDYITVEGKIKGQIGVKQAFNKVAVKADEYYDITQEDLSCFKADEENAHLGLVNNEIMYIKNKTEWGQMVQKNGATYYVNENGRASAEIIGNGKIWLNTKIDGSGSWCGVDNSNGLFKIGSRFYFQVIDDENVGKYYDKIGGEYRDKIESGKLKIFLIGVIDPDGNEYTTLESDLTCYVKINPNWDKDRLRAIFINGEKTEDIDVSYVETIESPSNEDKFAKLVIKHFSPYAIYQEKSQEAEIVQESSNDISVANNFATGDSVEYVYILGLWAASVIALAGIVVAKRKFNK